MDEQQQETQGGEERGWGARSPQKERAVDLRKGDEMLCDQGPVWIRVVDTVRVLQNKEGQDFPRTRVIGTVVFDVEEEEEVWIAQS